MATRTILLIDYDPGSIQSTLGPLVEAGYRVEVVNDGLAGLEAFDRLKPDMVLIEPMVPRKHGFQVCQEIKQSERGQHTPVLITTGFYRGRKHQLEAREYYGCDGYLEKPIAPDLLLATCEQHFVDIQAGSQPIEPPASSPRSEPAPVLEEMTDDEIMQRLDALIDSPESPSAPEAAIGEGAEDEVDRSFETTVVEAGPDIEVGSVVEAGPVVEPAVPVQPTAPTLPSPEAPSPETFAAPDQSAIPVAVDSPSVESVFEFEEPRTSSSPARASIEFDRRSPWLLRGSLIAGAVVLAAAAVTFALKGGGDSPVVAATTERSAPIAAPTPARPPASDTVAVQAPDPLAGVELSNDPPAPDTAAARVPDAAAEPFAGEPLTKAEPEPVQPPVSSTPRSQPARRPAEVEGPKPVVIAPITVPTPEPPAPASEPSESPVVSQVEFDAEPATTDVPDGKATPEAAGVESPGPAAFNPMLIDIPAPTTPEPDGVTGTQPETITERAEPPAPTEPIRPKARRGQLIPLAEVDTEPRTIERALPTYPALARRMRKQGRVRLEILVDETGKVAELQIADGVDRLLDDAAKRAARSWTYEPAVKDSVPVRVWITEEINFRL